MSLPLSINTFFYGDISKEIKNWEIKLEHIKALKNQIPIFVKGYYCPKVLTLSNKETYEKFKPNNLSLEDFLTEVSISLQLYVRSLRITDLSDSFIEQFGVKDYHINLINRIYSNIEYGNDISIEIGHKRPFGNSFIEGDILEEVEPDFNDEDDEEYGLSKYDKNEDHYNTLAWKIYDEVMEIFVNILKEFPIKYRHYEYMDFNTCELLDDSNLQKQYFYFFWTISKIYLRDEFLNNLLNDI